MFKNGKQEAIDTDIPINDIIALPNDQIVCASYNDKCVELFDHNLNLLKKISRINGDTFAPIGLTSSSEEKKIFISDNLNDKIIMTDYEFNKIKAVGSIKGSDKDQFNSPSDLCFINNCLYVCDYNNKRIQIYSKDLEFIKSFKTSYKPWKSKASMEVLCVESSGRESDVAGIYFYNLEDLTFRQSYNKGICRISELNGCFYEFNHKNKMLFFYNENGKLIENATLTSIDDYTLGPSDGSFIQSKRTILMTSYSTKKIIRFSRN